MSVTQEKHGDLVIITIDRPDVRNAVDHPTATALLEAFRAFDSNKQQRAAVLTGADGHFCAGADLKAVAEGRGNRVTLDGDGPLGPTRMLLNKPVIAAVEGYAVAGGLELALWCDLRVAARDAVFGVYCRRWGVPLVDGGTVRLPRLIGQSHALDMILTGRGVSGEEARMMGLANRLTDPGEALHGAVELAEQLTRFPQRCMLSDRRSAITQWSRGMDEALSQEALLGREVIKSGETVAGAARFNSGAGRHGDFSDI
ncbi:MAG: crotonase/enoyl-CoA hydratase family protein [Gammaproteobacteria bacterium]|nr:crotonase/enoyl-CoA hydratase family protein [Gammaproteobacteria bacterium]